MKPRLEMRSFRVLNYKSCRDSSECYLGRKITLLAGKNESGKTAVLEGLDRLYNGHEISPLDRNNAEGSGEPTAYVRFACPEKMLAEIEEASGVRIAGDFRDTITEKGLVLKFEPGLDPDIDLPDLAFTGPHPQELTAARTTLDHNLASIAEMLGEYEGTDLTEYDPDVESAYANLETELESMLTGDYDVENIDVVRANIRKAIDAARLLQTDADARERFSAEVRDRLPNVIFFSEEENKIKYETSIDEALKNPAITRLARIANLDLLALKSEASTQAKKTITATKSASISERFRDSWLQDEVNIRFDTNGTNLLVYFEEEKDVKPYNLDQRSKGFQWYVSFYARLQGEVLEGAVILIDEPGLYLHAKAQKNLLGELERATERVQQVIFTTHSPYLIDANHMERVRTVVKYKDRGTIVHNKPHVRLQEEGEEGQEDTITPILTAIGDEMGSGVSFARNRNVVFEGPSDSYFVRAMARLLNRVDVGGYHLIGCVGASKVPQVCSILHGWGLKYVAVFDNDREGRKTLKEIQEKFYENAPCEYVSDKAGVCVEDLFSKAFFGTYVIEEQVPADKSNSEHLKALGDKVVKSRLFLERVERDQAGIVVDDETRDAFTALFDKIAQHLREPEQE